MYTFDHMLLITFWNELELEFGYLFLDDRKRLCMRESLFCKLFRI